MIEFGGNGYPGEDDRPAASEAGGRRVIAADFGDRRRGTRQGIRALWDELADFPASRSDDALDHLMKALCDWVKADNALWIGAVRVTNGEVAADDPQHGWRGRVTRRLVPMPDIAALARRAMSDQGTRPSMTTCAITAGAGRFRVHRLHDGFVDFAAFRRTAEYRDYYQGMGIVDRMWIASPINRDAESYVVLDLHRTRRRFSPADATLAGEALSGLKWFHRNLMLNYGLPLARTPLSPTQRKVLALLLTDKSEKEIAHQLALSAGTAHQYVVGLFRKFRVNSRAGLMALWMAGSSLPTD